MTKLTNDQLSVLLSSMETRMYSGRGMYGRQCLAIVTEGGQSLLSLAADLVEAVEDTSAVVQMLRDAATDNLGRETIVYWPAAWVKAS